MGLTPNVAPEAKGKANSTTYSAIADGRISVLDGQTDVNTIRKDTQNTLNKLAAIFDKKTVEEKQELAMIFSQYANEAAMEKGASPDEMMSILDKWEHISKNRDRIQRQIDEEKSERIRAANPSNAEVYDLGESTIISEGEIEDASYLNAIAKKYKVEYSYENDYTGDNVTNNFIVLRNAFKKKYGSNSYYDAFINTVWGRTLSETARLKGRWLGEKFGEQAFKGSLKYTKAIGRALSKKVVEILPSWECMAIM